MKKKLLKLSFGALAIGALSIIFGMNRMSFWAAENSLTVSDNILLIGKIFVAAGGSLIILSVLVFIVATTK